MEKHIVTSAVYSFLVLESGLFVFDGIRCSGGNLGLCVCVFV